MKTKIAVLGAGPMGLAVAFELVKQGYQPEIYEMDDRVGGMTACFDFSGVAIERFYHFHCTSDHAFLEILDELGIADQMHWCETKMGFWYQNQIHPWGNPWALLKFKPLSLISRLRYGLHAFYSSKRNNWQALDQFAAIDWIKKWVGHEAYDVVWSKLFEYKFYHYSPSISAAWIWSRIRRIARSRYDLFREKLGYLQGGSTTFLNAIQHYIQSRGGHFHLNSPIQRVLIENEKIKGIEVNNQIIQFDHIISTIPLPYIAEIMPDLPQSILGQYQSVDNIAVVCLIIKLNKSLSPYFWLNVNDPNMDIPGLVEYSHLRTLKETIVYVPFYMPGDHEKYQEPNQAFIEKVKTYLKKINPDLAESDFMDIKVSRYRFAQPICTPKHLEKLPAVDLPIQGLWVADTSYYYPEDRGISESIDFGRQLARMACP